MNLDKLIKIYHPVEELMYTEGGYFAESVEKLLKEHDQVELQFEVITKENCKEFVADGFFNAKTYLQKRSLVLGVKIDGQPVGYAAAILKGGHSTYFRVRKSDLCLCGLYTYETYRGRGIMTQLVKKLYDMVSETEEIKLISLNVRPDNPAKKLYQKWGFEYSSTVSFLKKWFVKIPYYRI